MAPAAGREVAAVDVETSERYETTTNVAGSYSLMLPPGRYRVELTLEPGESVVEEPGIVTVEASELAEDNDITLGGAGVVQEED